MEKFRYHEMLPHEIVRRRREFPAAFVASGCLEWHGEHLAVGNDALKAEKLCELAAQKSGGFAFPTLWYGDARGHSLAENHFDDAALILEKMELEAGRFTSEHFGKTREQEIEFYRQLVYHLLVQMNQLGMRAVCLVTGHAPLHYWAQEPVKKFNRSFQDTQVFAAMETLYCEKRDDLGVDHAAKWETSFLWYLRPDCVDLSVYNGRDDETLVGVKSIDIHGPVEDPRRTASKEIGRKASELMVEGMIRRARELLQKAQAGIS
jgi:creatinine amidohydrolase/Fe(II)-dependent formamide hydrolase-like protein